MCLLLSQSIALSYRFIGSGEFREKVAKKG